MRIQFTTSVAGARFDYAPEEIVDLPRDQALEFIRLRQAVELKEEAVAPARERATASGLIETATQVVAETAKGIRRRFRRNGSHPSDLLPPQ